MHCQCILQSGRRRTRGESADLLYLFGSSYRSALFVWTCHWLPSRPQQLHRQRFRLAGTENGFGGVCVELQA